MAQLKKGKSFLSQWASKYNETAWVKEKVTAMPLVARCYNSVVRIDPYFQSDFENALSDDENEDEKPERKIGGEQGNRGKIQVNKDKGQGKAKTAKGRKATGNRFNSYRRRPEWN